MFGRLYRNVEGNLYGRYSSGKIYFPDKHNVKELHEGLWKGSVSLNKGTYDFIIGENISLNPLSLKDALLYTLNKFPYTRNLGLFPYRGGNSLEVFCVPSVKVVCINGEIQHVSMFDDIQVIDTEKVEMCKVTELEKSLEELDCVEDWTPESVYRVAPHIRNFPYIMLSKKLVTLFGSNCAVGLFLHKGKIVKIEGLFPDIKLEDLDTCSKDMKDLRDLVSEMSIHTSTFTPNLVKYRNPRKYWNSSEDSLLPTILNLLDRGILGFYSIINTQFVCLVIEGCRLEEFESLLLDTQEDVWSFIDWVNEATDEDIKALAKRGLPPLEVQKLNWRKYLNTY